MRSVGMFPLALQRCGDFERPYLVALRFKLSKPVNISSHWPEYVDYHWSADWDFYNYSIGIVGLFLNHVGK
jgi:hypothetical protein